MFIDYIDIYEETIKTLLYPQVMISKNLQPYRTKIHEFSKNINNIPTGNIPIISKLANNIKYNILNLLKKIENNMNISKK